MSGLDAYKLDKAFTEGVEIRLDDAPDVVFLVRLPSQYNRAYSQAMFGSMEFDLDSGGVKPKVDILDTKYAQQDAFINHCVVSMDGEPLPDNFINDYPSAVDELVEKAGDLAAAIERGVDDSVKKSQPSSTGKGSGQVKRSSTESLSSVAG